MVIRDEPGYPKKLTLLVARKRYSPIKDTARSAKNLSWKKSFFLGVFAFALFYLLAPILLGTAVEGRDAGIFNEVIRLRYEYYVKGFKFTGIACLLVAVFYGLKNLLVSGFSPHNRNRRS